MASRRRRKSRIVPEASPAIRVCGCGERVRRFWPYCAGCGRAQVWGDEKKITGAECARCRWVVADRASFCSWCGWDIHEEHVSSDEPLRAPRGFRFDAKCDAGCGGGVQYPMPYCPWCGKMQHWNEDRRFEGSCPHCGRGVDDRMDHCPWCGRAATGQDLIPRALTRVRRLLLVSRIRPWGYRVLLRPGVSGVDPAWPRVVEIDEAYVVTWRRNDEIPWSMLVGLICHELGHSFLFQHWRWSRTPEFRRVFGEVTKAYRVRDNAWVDFQRRRVSTTHPDHVTAYAMTHPQEDFAETFRFYVTRRGRMRELLAELGRKRKSVTVYEKFLVLHHYLRRLRARPDPVARTGGALRNSGRRR